MATLITSGTGRRCDGTCHHATGSDCRCICEGRYHGKGEGAAGALAADGGAWIASAGSDLTIPDIQTAFPIDVERVKRTRRTREKRAQAVPEGRQGRSISKGCNTLPHNVEDNPGNGNPAWRTPEAMGEAIFHRHALNFDAFADHANALARHYTTIEGEFRSGLDWPNGSRVPAWDAYGGPTKASDGDGLTLPWAGLRVFVQPPYGGGMMARAVEKCISEAQGLAPNPHFHLPAFVVGLFMADTSTTYWRERVIPNAESIEYLPRVRYELSPDDLAAWREKRIAAAVAAGRKPKPDEMPSSPNFGSAIVVFKGPRITSKGYVLAPNTDEGVEDGLTAG